MIGRPRTPTIAQTLSAKPRHSPDVTFSLTVDGGRLIAKLKPYRRIAWLFRLPDGATKTFELDAVGVFVWDCLDGKTAVERVIRRVAERFGLNLRQAQVSTLAFLRTLARKGLIGVDPPREGRR